jgi:transcriptional regulator with XRE-family HTH domain
MKIGQRIKEARIKKKLTQEELGKIIGVQKSAIAKYESGRVVNIKRSTLKKLSDILEIPPFDLVFTEEHKAMQQKNSTLTDITIRVRTDAEFADIVKGISQLSPEQLASVKQVVDLFLKGN